MIGRREFGIAGASALAIAALERSAFAQTKKEGDAKHGEHSEHDDMFAACAKACSDCQRACDSCATHCAHKLQEGAHEHMTTLATCLDCADVCAAAARIVARKGPFAVLVCEPCIEACARCAKECEKFPDDAHMKKCAEECRRCEKACKEMVAHAKHATN